MPAPAVSFRRRRALARMFVCVYVTACHAHPWMVTADGSIVCVVATLLCIRKICVYKVFKIWKLNKVHLLMKYKLSCLCTIAQ